jgi:iron complex transport system substrate-binding protein
MRLGRGIRRALAAFLVAAAPVAAAGEKAPERVVSVNLCTDQLALILGAPGQVASVSHWAARPAASNLHREARALPLNGGGAEEVYLMRPDLVLAGTYTNRASVALLRRLGVRVELFPPARSFEEVTAALRRMGRLLGREARAAEAVAAFEARLAAIRARARALPREAGAFLYPNSYTAGAGTLASGVLDAAGLDNAAAELGLEGPSQISLEALVMLDPFLVRTEHISGAGAGRAFEPARHPALDRLAARGRGARIPERWQACGTPFVARAVEALVEARLAARVGRGGAARAAPDARRARSGPQKESLSPAKPAIPWVSKLSTSR